MYFSLITISTVGFGDFASVTDLGRMASASEAVIGQVFLVTFVALIVSRFAAGMPRALGRRARRGAPGAGAAHRRACSMPSTPRSSSRCHLRTPMTS